MAKSILPSTARKSARRGKASAKRAYRRSKSVEAHQFSCDPEAFNDGFAVGSDQWVRKEIRNIVSNRREGDKLNHFIRWAERITKNIPRDSRLSTIRALLPDGLIGEHALGHLKNTEHFMTEAEWAEHFSRYGRYRYSGKRNWVTNEQVIEALRDIIRTGYHGEFNRFLAKNCLPLAHSVYRTQYNPVAKLYDRIFVGHRTGTRARRLLNLADVEAFWNDCRKGDCNELLFVKGRYEINPNYNPYLRKEVQRYLSMTRGFNFPRY